VWITSWAASQPRRVGVTRIVQGDPSRASLAELGGGAAALG
jgi:hypothetical protein